MKEITQQEKIEALLTRVVEIDPVYITRGFNSSSKIRITINDNAICIFSENPDSHIVTSNYITLFDLRFVKALFGSEYVCNCCGKNASNDALFTRQKLYDFHLQQAAASPSPLDYLYKAVFGE